MFARKCRLLSAAPARYLVSAPGFGTLALMVSVNVFRASSSPSCVSDSSEKQSCPRALVPFEGLQLIDIWR